MSDPDDELQSLKARVAELEAELRHHATSLTSETERRLTEATLESLPGVFFLIDDASRLRRWNKNLELVLGRSHAELEGQSAFSYIAPEDLPATQTALKQAFEVGEGHAEAHLVNARGERIPFSLSGRRVELDGATYVCGTGIDLRDRRADQQALARSERRYEQLVATMNEGLALRDPEGRVTYVNERFCEVLGLPREALIGARLEELLEDPKALRADRSGAYEVAWKAREGGRVETLISEQPLPDASQTLSVVTDISHLKQLEEALRQSQKMEAIGLLAGGIAHDFNNLLTGIIGYAELGLLRQRRGQPRESDLEAVLEAARRAQELTQQLLAFSRKQVLKVERLDLAGVVERLDRILRRLIGEQVELSTRIAAETPWVEGDWVQVEQIILNLAVNARDAMPAGGRLSIETGLLELDDEGARRFAELGSGRYASLRVTDEGEGMDEATAQRVFEPFFTTKGRSQGTGLGLSTVYGIVKQHGGAIEISSRVGEGTIVEVLLPASAEDGRHPSSSSHREQERPLEASGRILVVEDEDVVRLLAEDVLRSQGYEVVSAASPREALVWAEGQGEGVDLLLTDVIMPGMTGRDLARELTARWPGLRVLYMSGYARSVVAPTGVLDEAEGPLLSKPLGIDALLRAVQSRLAE